MDGLVMLQGETFRVHKFPEEGFVVKVPKDQHKTLGGEFA